MFDHYDQDDVAVAQMMLRGIGNSSVYYAHGDTNTNINNNDNHNHTTNGTKKRRTGPSKGTSYKKAADRATWFRACHTYSTHPACKKMSYADFLRSPFCPPEIGGYNHSTRRAFSKKLKEYQNKTLNPSDTGKRMKSGRYPYLEQKLVNYIRERQKEQLAVNWSEMKGKVRDWIEEIEDEKERNSYDDFQISDGWISNILKRHNIKGGKEETALEDQTTTTTATTRMDSYGGNAASANSYFPLNQPAMGTATAFLGAAGHHHRQQQQQRQQADHNLLLAESSNNTGSRKRGRKTKQERIAESLQMRMTLLKSFNEIRKSNPEWDGDTIMELFPEMKPFVEAEKKAATRKQANGDDNNKESMHPF